MALLLALVMLLIPLAIAPGWLFYFDVTPKIVVLLLGTAAAAVWWAARWSETSRAVRWFLPVVCGMALSLAVSTLASTNRALSLGGSSWRDWGLLTQLTALGFACLVAACAAGRPEIHRAILRSAAAGGLLAAAYGIAQYFGWDALLDPRGYHAGEGVWTIVRPPSTLGHADYFANWMLFAVFAGVALALWGDIPFWKRLARVSALLGAAAIVLSGARAALAGLVAGALFLLLWRGLRPTLRSAAVALVCLAAAAAFYLSPLGARLRARVHWSLQEPAGGARLLLWRDSLRMAADRWPVGYGPDTFIAAFPLYQSPALARAYPDFFHESPHNIYLDALVAQGAAGPLLLLALGASGFAAAWSVRRRPLAGPLAAALAAMTISQQFACFTMPTALAYYVTAALLVSLGSAPAPALHRRWLRLAVSVPVAAILVYAGVRLWAAESALADVRRSLDAGSTGDAAARFADYQRWRWPGAGADLWYSRRLAAIAAGNARRDIRAQAFQQAGAAARRAVQTAETPFNAYYNLASFYAVRNNFAGAAQALRGAIACAPNWFKPHWMLAQVLEAGARLPEAEAEAALAADLDGGQHPEVAGTLRHIRAALSGAPAQK